MDVNGDPAAVVLDRDRGVLQDFDNDPVAEAGHCLVDGVVDDLVDKMVQPALVRAADIHAGAPPNGLGSLKDLNVLGGIGLRSGVAGAFSLQRHRVDS